MGPLGRRPASGGPASQTLRAPSTPHLPTSHLYTRTTDKQYRRQTRPNQDQTSLLKSRVSRPGALIGCHPQQSCPRRAHPETPPSALLSLGCADVQMPTMCPSQLLGTPFPWPILRLAREPTSHHAQTSRQKGYIEVVGGAGILRSGLPPSEWRAATQGFGRAIRHNNVPVHRGPRGYIRSLSHALMLTLRYTLILLS
jgi:hypothetical protein